MTGARRLPCRQRLCAPVVLVVAGGLTIAFDLRVVGFLVVVAGFGMAGSGLAAATVPARTRLDRLLAGLTFAVAALALVAEVLSLATLLGSEAAWIVGAVVCGVAGGSLPGRPLRRPRVGAALAALGLGVGATRCRLGQLRAAIVGVMLLAAGLHLVTVFVLSWFSGITVFDSISHYLPRSIRFLQYGTFGIEATYYDFMQYLHQTVVAVQLLFLRSDVLVNLTWTTATRSGAVASPV